VHDVRAKQQSGTPLHFIDVREDREFDVDRCAGARHMGRGILERDIEAALPDKSTEIILYCGGGFRSALSAASLADMGYARVFSMAGGIRAWRQAGLPLESDEG